MKGFRTIFSFFLLFIISISLVLSVSIYDRIGTEDELYELGIGFFNTQLTNFSTFTRSISNPDFLPLIADLDNDGIKEFVVIDGQNIRLFKNKELDIVETLLNTNISGLPYMLLFDIDNDNFIEIIIASSSSNALDIIEWNGTDFNFDNSYSLGANHSDGEIMINCRGTEDCFITYIESFGKSSAFRNKVFGRFFNSTVLGNQSVIFEGSSTNSRTICYSKIPSIAIADYDQDATDEYIFSFYEVELGASNDELRIVYIDINESKEVVVEQNIEVTSIAEFQTDVIPNFNCSFVSSSLHVEDYFSSPLVMDIDKSLGNGLETIIGFMVTSSPPTQFRINSFSSVGTFIDQYPFFSTGDGRIISNPFKATAFLDSEEQDFCVVGYESVEQVVDIVCASETRSTPLVSETAVYDFSIVGLFNVTTDFGELNVIAHSVQHSTLTTTVLGDTANLNEVITTYGIINLDASGTVCFQTGSCSANIIFSNPIGDAVILSVDYENAGRDDLILLSDTNLWYIDDQFTNTAGEIDSYFINPCLDNTWKFNTSVEIRIQVTDVNNDLVNANATLYFGQNFEQSAVSNNGSSGTTFTFSFIANQTIGSGAIRLVGKDVENPLQPDIIDLAISVGTEGVVLNDCVTDVDVITVTEALLIEEEEPEVEDAVSTTIDTIDTLLGLGLGRTIIWLIIMVFVSYAIWTGGALDRPDITFGIITLVNVLLLVIGFKLGFIGIGIIFIVIIGLLGSLAIRFRQMATGGG